MLEILLAGFVMMADPTNSSSPSTLEKPPVAQAATKAKAAAKTEAAQAKGEAPPAKAEAAKPAQLDPELKKAVDQMQKFYENTKDFEARFQQSYLYKSMGMKKQASGRVRFMKSGGSMRWDYEKPDEKAFVISGKKLYAYVKDAKQLTISGVDTEQLSASITFLWGQGKLEREFDIEKATRQDLTGGIALKLTPKKPDPRFQQVYFLLDPKSFSVRETLVVDPDGSENRMVFSSVKTNAGFGTDVFALQPPADTQIVRLDGAPASKP